MRLILPLAIAAAAAVPVPPRFPASFSAQLMGYQYDANGQLEQESHINSCWQYDGTQNRTAYQALDGGDGQVYDFKNAIAYVLQDNYCQFVCQIMETEPCDLEDSLCSYDYIHGAQFNGTALINGQDANSFTWTEGIGPIVMNTLTLYTAANASEPLEMYRNLTPLGEYDGAVQFMYANWTAGAPSASCFDVPGAEYCPYGDPDAQCQDFVTKATDMRRAMRIGGIFAGRK